MRSKNVTVIAWAAAGALSLALGSAALLLQPEPAFAMEQDAQQAKAVDNDQSKAKADILPPKKTEAPQAKNSDLIPLKVELPKPLFTGTPKIPPPGLNINAKELGKRRGDFLVPKGVELVSKNKPVKMSDENPIIGDDKVVTDGSKEGTDGNWVELAPGLQWVQIDLGKPHEIYAVGMWHYHAAPRVYRDVVVQVANDPDFIENVRTIYNNDNDNSAGLGLGKDFEYFESDEGKIVDGKGETARYVRFYSKGNTDDTQNHYIEAEVYGKPAK